MNTPADEDYEALLARHNALVSFMHHDLKTPLVAISMLTESVLAELYGPLPDLPKQAVTCIQKSCRQAIDLIQQQLDASHAPLPPSAPMVEGKRIRTILLVEDDVAILKVSGLILRRAGYELLTHENPVQALAAAQAYAGAIDLLLTDLVMPGMSGEELYRTLQATRPALAVLYMSSYSADLSDRHGMRVSEANYIEKPFTAEQLLAKVESLPADCQGGAASSVLPK
jgi:CheY-like chemotaxis protein